MKTRNHLPKPPWLRVRVGQGLNFERMRGIIEKYSLHTVCEEALCPNLGHCWKGGHATIMILGDVCTRACKFCNVSHRTPKGVVDGSEPERVAAALAELDIKNVVLTSVTRDDLPDGGAGHWAETIRRVRAAVPKVTIEVLIPDFSGDKAALNLVIEANPDIIGHNLETVPSLYPVVRQQANFARSLAVLAYVHDAGIISKTALMLGLGETEQEVEDTMKKALDAGCDILFLGQYLQPTAYHIPVFKYVEPVEFDAFEKTAQNMAFGVVVSGPLVRSSYFSEEQERFVSSRTNRREVAAK